MQSMWCNRTSHPFIKKVEHVDISSENLEKMRADVDNLRKKQETASTEAGAAGAEYNTRKNTYVETIGRLPGKNTEIHSGNS